MVPQHIADLIPLSVVDTTQYGLRNDSNLRNAVVRTTISQKPCIP